MRLAPPPLGGEGWGGGSRLLRAWGFLSPSPARLRLRAARHGGQARVRGSSNARTARQKKLTRMLESRSPASASIVGHVQNSRHAPPPDLHRIAARDDC